MPDRKLYPQKLFFFLIPQPMKKFSRKVRYYVARFFFVGLIGLFMLFWVLMLVANPSGLVKPQPGSATLSITPFKADSIVASDVISKSGIIYLLLNGIDGLPDLFRFNPASDAEPINLTNSNGISEAWPSVSPSGESIAYFGISLQGPVHLYVVSAKGGNSAVLTTDTGQTSLRHGYDIDVSQPPRWSLDGTWLAFLAKQTDKRGNAVELYVVRSDGTGLQTLTNNGNQVIDFAWLSDDEISYVEVRGDGQGVVYKQKVDVPPPVPTPTLAPSPIATLQISR